ncbi:MAG: hypothetical protein R6V28_14270 [Nitriliruptoraceae bacterium]
MKRRRTTLLEVVDRLVVILVGLALAVAGAAILAVALDLLEAPDLPGTAETVLERLEAWPAAAVIGVAALVAVLSVAFSIRHLLPAHQQRAVSELRLPSGEGRHHTEVVGRALTKAVEADLGRLPSVRDSSARLVAAAPPSVDVSVTTSLSCDLDELREQVTAVVERLDRALGRSDVHMRVRVGFDRASQRRVE